MWLLGAIALSMILHLMLIYIDFISVRFEHSFLIDEIFANILTTLFLYSQSFLFVRSMGKNGGLS